MRICDFLDIGEPSVIFFNDEHFTDDGCPKRPLPSPHDAIGPVTEASHAPCGTPSRSSGRQDETGSASARCRG
jgi:hypothetical protein